MEENGEFFFSRESNVERDSAELLLRIQCILFSSLDIAFCLKIKEDCRAAAGLSLL